MTCAFTGSPGTAVEAYALPGWPGRIVVSGRLLEALDEPGRAALLAHERAGSRRVSLAWAGPVPRRVAAPLGPPPRSRVLLLAAAVVIVLLTGARRWQRPGICTPCSSLPRRVTDAQVSAAVGL